MSTFSERYGYVVKPLQLESMTIELRNRIWNIYRCEICNDIAVIDSHYLEEIMDACGLSYTSVYDNADLDKNLAVFRKWYDQAEWYRIYDFVEIYLAFLPTKDLSDAIDNFNGVLSAENAGYRVIGRQVVPITNEYEIKCIYIHFVADMKDGDIEQWYDDMYQMCLLAFLELDHLERKERVKKLKEDIQKNG